MMNPNNVEKTPLKVIDLFAGAGGLSLGFSRKFGHELEIVWANDADTCALETYVTNFLVIAFTSRK